VETGEERKMKERNTATESYQHHRQRRVRIFNDDDEKKGGKTGIKNTKI
jgi:hypothetical protein